MTDKLKNILVTIIFCCTIIYFLFANLIKEDDLISISERRKLTSFPEISLSKILDGSFFKKFDNYTTDQFIEREKFRSLKVYTEFNIFKKNDYNNLYKYNDYIIENLYPLNETSVNNLIKKINQIQDTYISSSNNVYFTIIPDKNYFVSKGNIKMDYSKLEQTMINNIDAKYIPIRDALTLNDYYKTDSHWKQENLQKIAQILLNSMGYEYNVNFIKEEVISFKGTYAGRISESITADKITILTNEVLDYAKVFNYDKKANCSIYDYEKLTSLDKYDIYLSGATSLLTIENTLSTSNKEIIIFRDSYGSSIIPLLVPVYKKITIVDTRYISPKLLKNYINFNSQDILFMYSTLLINNSFSLK